MNRWENKSIEEDAAACQERIVITILFVSFWCFCGFFPPSFPFLLFPLLFFSFLGHQNLNYAQRVSEASGWRGTVTCLCVTYNIEREREGRGIRQNQEKIEEESVDRRYTAIPCR